MKYEELGLVNDFKLNKLMQKEISFSKSNLQKIKNEIQECINDYKSRMDYNHYKIPTQLDYVYTLIEDFKGLLLVRGIVIRVRYDKRKKEPLSTSWMEVFRSIEGSYIAYKRNCYVTNGGYSGQSKFHAIFEKDKFMHRDYWYIKEVQRNVWENVYLHYLDNFSNKLYTLDEVLSIKPELKYSMVSLDNNLIEYLAFYRKYPEIEFLKKCNFDKLLHSKRCLNRLHKGDKTFMKFLFKCYEIGKIYETYEEYLSYYKHYKMDMSFWDEFNYTISNVYHIRNKKLESRYCYYKFDPFYEKFTKYDDFQKIYRYCKRKNVDTLRYKDYFDMAAKIGHNMDDEYWLFPNDLNKAHDKVMAQIKEINSLACSLRGDYLRCVNQEMASKYNAIVDGYSIFIPTDINDIQKQCDVLYQCLIRNGYVNKVLMQEEILVFIWKDEIPIATAEVFYDKKVGQFYGDERGHSQGLSCLPSEEVQQAFYKWLETFKPSKAKCEPTRNRFYKGFHSVDDNGVYHTSYGNYSFEVGKIYATNFDDETILNRGGSGCVASNKVFHFCETITEISNHYSPKCYAIVEALGPVLEFNGACLSNKIKIVQALSDAEVQAIIKNETQIKGELVI